MGLFNFSGRKEGGFMDVIRCDAPNYLVWKWTPDPDGLETKKENSIRYGSSLRVKSGEVAVFVYPQKNGQMQDYIEGPYDKKIETANFPVLTSIVGAAFGGNSPFQAEIYFINLSDIQTDFAVPYFPVRDPEFIRYAVPVAVHCSFTFRIADYQAFISKYRMIGMTIPEFITKIRTQLSQFITGAVAKMPAEMNVPAIYLSEQVEEISSRVSDKLAAVCESKFGVELVEFSIDRISADETSEGYQALLDLSTRHTEAIESRKAEIEGLMAEEYQRAQRLQTESTYINAHALDQQTEVMKIAAESMGKMNSTVGTGGGSGDGFNPAGVMVGMMMGGAMGQQMAGMFNQMGANMNPMNGQMPAGTPPPVPTSQYHVAVNGQQAGPYTVPQLQQFAASGQFTADTLVWKNGMSGWSAAKDVPELAQLFMATPPPPPPPTL